MQMHPILKNPITYFFSCFLRLLGHYTVSFYCRSPSHKHKVYRISLNSSPSGLQIRTNEEILKTTKQDEMGKVMETRRWKYLGHVLRKRESPMAVSLGWEPEGKRRPGRPKQTWRRVVLKRMKSAGINSWNEAAELAKDRESWKQKRELLCLPLCATRLSAT